MQSHLRRDNHQEQDRVKPTGQVFEVGLDVPRTAEQADGLFGVLQSDERSHDR